MAGTGRIESCMPLSACPQSLNKTLKTSAFGCRVLLQRRFKLARPTQYGRYCVAPPARWLSVLLLTFEGLLLAQLDRFAWQLKPLYTPAMLIIVVIIVTVVIVASIERVSLKMPLRQHAHNRYYPFPSYSRQRYYRKIMFPENELIAVYDNFKKIQQMSKPSLSIDGESSFLNVVKDVVKKKTPLRIVECGKIPGVLVYTDNTQSPTHVFCMSRHVSEIVKSGKCDIEDEIDIISKSIVDREKCSLNQFGLIVLISNLEYLPHIVWGKHGDYIVGWCGVDPVILMRIGDEVRDKLKKFHNSNPILSNMVISEWDKKLFLCTIENSSMCLMVKHNTPKNIFVVHFRKKLSHLGYESYTRLDKEDKKLVNKIIRDIYAGRMRHIEIEDRKCFGNELGQFLWNLKEFVSDGTWFKLSPQND